MRSILNNVFGRSKRRRSKLRRTARRRARRLMCEMLEDRRMLSIGEYPELPGLHLVDPRPDQFEGQIIYLDFDGAEDVTYNGPVVVEDIDIPAFEAPGELAGQEDAIIASVVEQLEQTFAGSGLIFTTEQPVDGVEYSTIHIGGDDSAFREHGSFFGVAEAIDVRNQNRSDNAFVFSRTLRSTKSHLTHTILHEAMHLLGFQHTGSMREKLLYRVLSASLYELFRAVGYRWLSK